MSRSHQRSSLSLWERAPGPVRCTSPPTQQPSLSELPNQQWRTTMSATGTKDDLRRQQSIAHDGIPFINHQNETMTTTTSIDQKVRETGDGAMKETVIGSCRGWPTARKCHKTVWFSCIFRSPPKTPQRRARKTTHQVLTADILGMEQPKNIQGPLLVLSS